MESFIAVDKKKLASSVAQVMIEDKVMSPVCLSERTIKKESDFCHFFYDQFQQQLSTTQLDSSNVVHIINISTPETMDIEFERILATLHSRQYVADAYVTFSEYAFQMINNVRRFIVSMALLLLIHPLNIACDERIHEQHYSLVYFRRFI